MNDSAFIGIWPIIASLFLMWLNSCYGVELISSIPKSSSTTSSSLHIYDGLRKKIIPRDAHKAQDLQQFISPYTIQSTPTSISSGPAEGPAEEVVSVTGGTAQLPCDLTQPGDSPILVLFYNGITGRPLYSIDARDGPLRKAVHWSSLGDRAHFDLSTRSRGRHTLLIRRVEADDEAEYRCRVDFKSSPTRNLRINLRVLVPPQKITISTNESRKPLIGVIGPFPLGTHLSLTCTVMGGRPSPEVTWWHSGSKIDVVSEQVTEVLTRNTLTLPNLSRHHLSQIITCKASNSNRTQSINASVTLDMTFPPLEVRIINRSNVMKEGGQYPLICESSGSRPPVTLSWWVDGVPMKDAVQQTTKDVNVSRSSLYITPTRDSDGAVVMCQAVNPKMPSTPMEDVIKLNVQYAPKLQLRAGQNLVMTNIKEGDDVYFECDIQANPRVQVVRWFLDDVELHHNVSRGIIQSNQSLVLQGVNRTSSGLYICQATNIQATSKSSPILLTVKYSPICDKYQKRTYGIGLRESVNISCTVESYPEAEYFKWAFNSTTEMVNMPKNASIVDKNTAFLSYTPITHHDFGTILCWAKNEVGFQNEPCLFLIVPAAVPDPVQNCSVWQNSSTAGEGVIACFPGWNGGLIQHFTLKVIQKGRTNPGNTFKLLRNHNEPYFIIQDLKPGLEYKMEVVASNNHGSSSPIRFEHHMPIDVAEKRTSAAAAAGNLSSSQVMTLAPMLAVVAGVVTSIILCSVVLVLAIRFRLNQQNTHEGNTEQTCQSKSFDKQNIYAKTSDDGGFPQLKREPDLILVKEEQEDRQMMDLYSRPHTIEHVGTLSQPLATSNSGILTQSTSSSVPSSDINPSGGSIITHSSNEGSSMYPLSNAIINRGSGGSLGGAHCTPNIDGQPDDKINSASSISLSSITNFPPYPKGSISRFATCSDREAGMRAGIAGAEGNVGIGAIQETRGREDVNELILSSNPLSSLYSTEAFSATALGRYSSPTPISTTLPRKANSSVSYRESSIVDLNRSRESCV